MLWAPYGENGKLLLCNDGSFWPICDGSLSVTTVDEIIKQRAAFDALQDSGIDPTRK